jgi:hypothetical protein
MNSMNETAERFLDACETGKGWGVCRDYCHPEATFSAQFDGDRIRHMTKIWNDGFSLKQLGWA